MTKADYLKENRYTSGYMGKDNMLPKKFQKNVARCVKFLKTINKRYDSIAFTGMSGALVAPILAYKLNKHLLLVRKENEERHSWQDVEGFTKCSKYIIVDDFIVSGKTVERIQEKVFEDYPAARCIGTLQYTRNMSLSKISLIERDK